MAEIKDDKSPFRPEFWRTAIINKTRLGLSDLPSLQAEKAAAEQQKQVGIVTIDTTDGLVPFTLQSLINFLPAVDELYSAFWISCWASEVPGVANRWIVARSAAEEDLQFEIYLDRTTDLFPSGVGDRVNLAELSVTFFEGLRQDSPPPLTNYNFANYLSRGDWQDAKGDKLEFAKFLEASHAVTNRITTLALYHTSQENEHAHKLALLEVGDADNERGGSLTFLVGEPAQSIDAVALLPL